MNCTFLVFTATLLAFSIKGILWSLYQQTRFLYSFKRHLTGFFGFGVVDRR